MPYFNWICYIHGVSSMNLLKIVQRWTFTVYVKKNIKGIKNKFDDNNNKTNIE